MYVRSLQLVCSLLRLSFLFWIDIFFDKSIGFVLIVIADMVVLFCTCRFELLFSLHINNKIMFDINALIINLINWPIYFTHVFTRVFLWDKMNYFKILNGIHFKEVQQETSFKVKNKRECLNWSQKSLVWVLYLSLIYYVTPGNLFNFYVPQFSHLWNGTLTNFGMVYLSNFMTFGWNNIQESML